MLGVKTLSINPNINSGAYCQRLFNRGTNDMDGRRWIKRTSIKGRHSSKYSCSSCNRDTEQNRTEHLFCFDLDNMSIIYTIITYTLQDQDIKQICTCTKAT